jgi:5-methylcytosine-specific restriction endonuclease McrA
MSTWGRRGVPRSKRNRILNRDNHECQIRGIGCTIVATEVDDIIPVSVSGISRADADDDMLQAVCHYCHHRKTERERLTALAASNARRAARRRPSQPHPGD